MNIKLLMLATGTLILSSSVNAATFIDTTPSWDGSSAISPFGEGNTATYGQTFTVGVDTQLDDFTYYLDDLLNPDFVDFEAYVMGWDGLKATGPVLYQSSAMSTTNNGGSDGFESFTINTGGLNLTQGNQYVAFFSASNLFDTITGTSKMGLINTDVYSGGSFVFLNNAADFSLLTANNWSITSSFDAAFTMNFSSASPVPVPAAAWLFGSGMLGLVGVARRKKT